MAAVNYHVPGLIVPVLQPSGMSCWAAMFTMMYSWRHQVSIAIDVAVATLGSKYVLCYTKDEGLSIDENTALAEAGGLIAEPLYNPTIEGWANLLRRYGLLWTSYGWQAANPQDVTKVIHGRHIIIITGLNGDGTADGTTVRYVDPSDGMFHTMTAAEFIGQHEMGFTLSPLTDKQLGQFSQIMHYPSTLHL